MPRKNQPRSAGAARGGGNPHHGKNTAKNSANKPGNKTGPGGPKRPAARYADRAAEHNVTPNRRHGFAGGERPYDYAFYESEPATPEYMRRLFAEHSFPVDEKQLRRFWLYYDLLRTHNAALDLTRIMGIEATVLKHFVDSAIILRWFEPQGPVLDIGSGPGFPGIPLAIMRPDLKFILAESRGKRVAFLEETINKLALDNTVIFPKSVREDSPLGEDFGVPVGDVVTRALETMSPTLERILPFILPGRRAAFLKGPGCDEEIAVAEAQFTGVYRLVLDKKYELPGSDQPRRLVVFEKTPRQK